MKRSEEFEGPLGERALARLRPVVERSLRRHVRDPHLREDLVQETLLRAFRGLHSLRDRGSLEAWAVRIAYHLAMDRHRRGPAPDRGEGGSDALLRTPLVQAPADHVKDLRERREHWLRSLIRALGELCVRDLGLVIGHYFVGHSCDEVARRTGLSLANVKVRLYRARLRIRLLLPEEAEFRALLWARSRYESDRAPGQGGLPRARPRRRAN